MEGKKNASPTKGLEHVKGYAESDAGKRGVCSEHVKTYVEAPRALEIDWKCRKDNDNKIARHLKHAKNARRTWKEHAKNLHSTAKNMQHAEHNTILKEHTDNGHHCQTSVCKFSIQLGFLHRGVRDLAQEGRKSNAIVARSSRHGGILHEAQAILSGEESRSLNQANEPQDLVPAKRLNSKSLQIWQVHEDIHAGTCWST